MGVFGRAKKVTRMAAEMGRLKAAHPQAWALGVGLAGEAMRTRSPDLVRMIRAQGNEGRDEYSRQVAERVVLGLANGDIEANFPLSQEALKAAGIACGTTISYALDDEANTL